ncbi:MAG: hypothetical protein QME64_10745 [bacterium]|nr:hypothetical protein [bacterium]
MVKKVGLLVFLVVMFVSLAYAESPFRMEFEGRYWMPELTSKAKVTEAGVVGTEIDLVSDLGFEDQDFPEGRLSWYLGANSKIRAAYTQFNYDGDNQITRTFNFNGEVYTVGTRVISDLNVQYLRVGWIWNFINTEQGKFKLGAILEGKGIWLDAKVDAPNVVPAISQEEEVVVGLPTLGATVEIAPVPKFTIFGEISGLPAGDFGYCFDAEAGVKIAPVANFCIIGGYRVLDVKGEDSDTDDFVKVKLKGAFAGASLRF